jgi:hypothetical protein
MRGFADVIVACMSRALTCSCVMRTEDNCSNMRKQLDAMRNRADIDGKLPKESSIYIYIYVCMYIYIYIYIYIYASRLSSMKNHCDVTRWVTVSFWDTATDTMKPLKRLSCVGFENLKRESHRQVDTSTFDVVSKPKSRVRMSERSDVGTSGDQDSHEGLRQKLSFECCSPLEPWLCPAGI